MDNTGNGNIAIFNAINDNKCDDLERLLSASPTYINAKDTHGDTPLHVAIKDNNTDMKIIQLLLQHKVDICAQNKDGNTPLHLAIENERKEDVHLIMKRKSGGKSFANSDVVKCLRMSNLKGETPESLINQFYKKNKRLWGDIHSRIANISQTKKRKSDDKGPSESEERKKFRNWKEHPASGLKYSLHGDLYQVKLLMLVLKSAIEKKYEFNFGSEVDSVGKFDDIVIRYKNTATEENNDNPWQYYLIQAKHTLTPDKNKITIKSLLTDKDENFSLQKYYLSFCDILNSELFHEDKHFLDNLDIVLLTNTDFNFDGNCQASQSQSQSQSQTENFENCFDINSLSQIDEFLFIKSNNKSKKIKIKEEYFDDMTKKIKESLNKKKANPKVKEDEKEKIEQWESDDEKMISFFKKLTFITNFHNESDLDSLLEIQFRKKYELSDGEFVKNSFQNNILNFLKHYDNGRSKFLSNEEGETIFKELKQKLKIVMTTGFTEFYLSKLENYKLSFTSDFMPELTDASNGFFDESNESLFLKIKTNSPLLSAIKMMQTIKLLNECDEETTAFSRSSFIFIKTDDLFESETLKMYVEDSFDSGECNRVLVLQIDEFKEECIDELNSTISNRPCNKSKKIILITPNESPDSFCDAILQSIQSSSSSLPSSDLIMFVSDEKINFEHLTPESQTFVLSTKIKFQGKPIELKQLINEIVAEQLIDSNDLMELIMKSNLKIGNQVPFHSNNKSSYGYKKSYYIDRNFSFQLLKFDAVMGKIDKALFFISNFETVLPESEQNYAQVHQWEKHEGIKNGIILAPSCLGDSGYTNQWKYDKLCTNHPYTTIYWLEYRNIENEVQCFLWQNFSGENIFNESDFLSDTLEKKYERCHLKESDIKMLKQRNIIVANDSGFGKSIFLTHLANGLREYETITQTWIIRVDLINYVYTDNNNFLGNLPSPLANNGNISIDKEKAKEFISQIAVRGKNKVLERKLLDKFIIHYDNLEKPLYPRIVILFDGFDEIVPMYREITLQLIKTLHETDVAQFVITTRTSEKKYLENGLKTPAIVLTSVTNQMQKDFLIKFWQFNCKKSRSKPNNYDFDDKAKELINFVQRSDGQNEYFTLTEVPLTLYLLAEHVQKKDFPRLSIDMLNDLYANVIDRKFEIYKKFKARMRDGNPSADPHNETTLVLMRKIHQELAFEHIFTNENMRPHSNEFNKYTDECKKNNKNVEKILKRAGLFKNKEYDFIHRAFAEYFLCEYWINNFEKQTKQNELIGLIFESDSLYEDIRSLLNTQLDKHSKYAEFLIVLKNLIKTNKQM